MASYPCYLIYLFFTRNMCPCVLPLQCESESVSQAPRNIHLPSHLRTFWGWKGPQIRNMCAVRRRSYNSKSYAVFMSASNLRIPPALVLGLPLEAPKGNW